MQTYISDPSNRDIGDRIAAAIQGINNHAGETPGQRCDRLLRQSEVHSASAARQREVNSAVHNMRSAVGRQVGADLRRANDRTIFREIAKRMPV